MTLLDHARIEAAARTLQGIAVRTPAITSRALDAEAGFPVLCKAENLQHTGSFKFRGAYNHTANLPAGQRVRGIIGASSGNHAQALALTAHILGIPATVVIPDDAPRAKVQGSRALGARIIRHQRTGQDRDALVARLAELHGLAIVPSANSADVMAGAGTAALELLTDHPHITTLLVPVGGGGLAAGTAVIAKHLNPRIQVIGVEPWSATDTLQSLRTGTRVTLPAAPRTIADGLGHTTPAELPFAINTRLLDDIVTVTDHDITTAMAYAFRHLKVVVEPSGACALAALLARRITHTGGTIGVMISGGGVDLAGFLTTISLYKEKARV
ncbi:threonine/serine dehydratase [Streptomyces sp. H27-H1]|uniref:threonine/serine dehydratase n=1 Tax=Streptomyces sp. H27-H1 TaxID=2996461 RepID=UPI002271FFBD|nr:threonine/serine dehydratase [Streptomyces sp. H27-H1]MCY0930984.1 threonine/serine dehydratase [Streptomyces sp. H27-H1]